MKFPRKILMVAVLFFLSAAISSRSNAQTQCEFKLSEQKLESTASQTMILGNDGVPRTAQGDWVPVYSRSKSDRIREFGSAIGRLDICWANESGETEITYCTANLLSRNQVLTNFHCTDRQVLRGTKLEDYQVEKIRLVLGFDDLQDTSVVRSYNVNTVPVRASENADAQLLEVSGDPNSEWGSVELVYTGKVASNEALTVIHHPASLSKMFNPIRCNVHASQDKAEPNRVRHVCDTARGSSGTLLLREKDLALVGLHFAGGLRPGDPNTFNYAQDLKFVAAELGLDLKPPSSSVRAVRATSSFYISTYPKELSVGDELSVIADISKECDVKFFILSPELRVTPIPGDFFTTHDFENGNRRHEISAATRFGLVVEESEPVGQHHIGFICAGESEIKQTLRQVVESLNRGQLSSSNVDGDTIFAFTRFEITE